jgi:xanthine dehydrogenase accessory factor
MHDVIAAICDTLQQGRKLVLASVCEHAGSTPRSSGAAMAVRPDGAITGTVGGGLSEAMAIREAVELLGRHSSPGPNSAKILRISLSNEQAAKAGMICGGDMAVLLERIDDTEENRRFFESVNAAVKSGRKVVLAAGLGPAEQGDAVSNVRRWAVIQGETPAELPEQTARRLSEAKLPGLTEIQGQRYNVQLIAVRDAAFLIGAGHVAVPTAKLAAMVGFRTVVMDDRPEFANVERFPNADAVSVLRDFTGCLTGQEVNEDSSLIIVTRGHLHDKTVLAQALRSKAGYVGMIGSRRKRDAIYEALREEGFTREDLARVHCPIGLTIDAETPEEIAVSIVGELIRERAERRRHGS